MNDVSTNYLYTQNRELSWLKFNERVLEEAQDPSVPLYEKLKFISIFTSNLDEFFMIRVGSLFDLSIEDDENVDNKSGMTPTQQLDEIYKEVRTLYKKRDNIFIENRTELRKYGVSLIEMEDLYPEEDDYVEEFFNKYIFPILSPQVVDKYHPFPFIENKTTYITVKLKGKKSSLLGIIPVPRSLPDVLFMPGDEIRFVQTEKVIYHYTQMIFDMYEVEDKNMFCVTRNGDISADDESFDVNEDFRDKMKKLLKDRKRLAVVRLETYRKLDDWMKTVLCEKLNLKVDQVFTTSSPFKMKYVYDIESKLNIVQRDILCYRTFTPQPSPEITVNEGMFSQVKKKDILLFYPYESMSPFLQMIQEAAHDPDVLSIKISIYRLARKAKLVDYLCAAAENGKEVTVLIELRARFDEQNNIDWSERLESEGCRVIYGFDEFKVHSKICVISRREHGEIRHITQIGTGNYNEKTAKIYTDLSLITADQDIGMDAMEFFRNMTMGNLNGHYEHLMVAPNEFKDSLIGLIDEEISKKESGRIIMKVNSITDIDVIRKLSEASCAGVKVDLLVRGICCILPGVLGKTENVNVMSIVGRFLEHSRIYSFGSGAEQKLYISSADLMTRNTERRVEIACPIRSMSIKEELNHVLEVLFCDTAKGRVLKNDGRYYRRQRALPMVDSQEMFMQEAQDNAEFVKTKKTSQVKKMLRTFGEWMVRKSSQ